MKSTSSPRKAIVINRIYCKISEYGIKCYFNNLSDKLNNMVRLNNICKIKEESINPDDLNIYNFKKESVNSFSTELIKIDSTGFFEKNFAPIVDKLYKESIEITNANERW